MSENIKFITFCSLKRTGVVIPLLFIFSIFKINAAFSQNVNFSAIELKNLGLVYNKAEDFEVERVIDRAFRIDLGASRNNMLVTAKVISTSNYAFETLSDNMYSIRLNDTDANLGGNYYRQIGLDLDEQIILEKGRSRGRNNRGGNYYIYDLIVAPVSYEYEPGQYHYSILFTVTAD
ncbi:hypothetical protein [Jiulongibacter sp. NS-SX5]|uniref:hypothetical protein n=1 Tax=Jiulongibacter sp. NS-SX5 TaxID=3463854 RepID=UPI004059559F